MWVINFKNHIWCLLKMYLFSFDWTLIINTQFGIWKNAQVETFKTAQLWQTFLSAPREHVTTREYVTAPQPQIPTLLKQTATTFWSRLSHTNRRTVTQIDLNPSLCLQYPQNFELMHRNTLKKLFGDEGFATVSLADFLGLSIAFHPTSIKHK